MNQLGSTTAQDQMIRQQILERGIRDERVLEAFRSVPREKFFLPEARESAFADRAAPIGHGQTISQPYIVALMTWRLDIQPTHRVLEIGTGSGYQTAILSRLAGEVYSIERVKPLLDDAWES
jgi:protein-L-isoaspartate(D-aspartate) O-methyltransferase